MLVQQRVDTPIELGCAEVADDDGDLRSFSNFQEDRRYVLPFRDYDARNIERQERPERAPLSLRIERAKIRYFCFSEHLDASGRKALGVPGEGQARAADSNLLSKLGFSSPSQASTVTPACLHRSFPVFRLWGHVSTQASGLL